MYLAAIADAQPQAPAAPPQVGVVSMTRCFTDSSFLSMLIIYVSTLADGPTSCYATGGILHATSSGSSNGSATGYFLPKDADAV